MSKKESIQQTACSRQGKTKGFLSTVYRLLFTKAGFSLVELMLTMVIFLIVIAAASGILTGMITQFKQQSKIAETNIEGIVGLDIMRRDIEHAGYGLPWNVTGVTDADDDGNFWEHLPNYEEATATEAAAFNDATRNIDGDGNDGEAPRAIVTGDNMNFSSPNNPFDGSDYLVIKAANVATSAAAQRWTRLGAGNAKRNGLSGENFADADRVIVISPGTEASRQALVVADIGGGTLKWWTQYETSPGTVQFAPGADETRYIYGIDSDTDLRMPFNRADYYINREGTTTANDGVPDRCALGTGVLRKAVISQNNGERMVPLPLLDCVADMQVVYLNAGAYTADISGLSAQQIREQVREVRVYILAHEGQYDRDYTFNNFTCGANCITVGEFGMGRNFDLSGITNWQNYRWKVYTIVVKPINLR